MGVRCGVRLRWGLDLCGKWEKSENSVDFVVEVSHFLDLGRMPSREGKSVEVPVKTPKQCMCSLG